MKYRWTIGICFTVLCLWFATALLIPISSSRPPQLPSQVELSCPQGSSPMPGGATQNLITQKYRQWLCVDSSGNVIMQSGGVGSTGNPGPFLSLTPNTSQILSLSSTVLQIQDSTGNVQLNMLGSSGASSFGRSNFATAAIFNGVEISNGTNNVSGCSLSSAAGGAGAGKFASGTSGACTVTITLPTALNGWTCDAHDLTTAADANNVVQTAFTVNTATISGTTVSGDIITWKCEGF